MNQSVWGSQETEFFYGLTPEIILSSIDTLGFKTTGRVLTLNSMENRVYEVEVDDPENDTKFIIAKFYRPGRWSVDQILDEHQFLLDLDQEEVPVIAPIQIKDLTVFKCEQTNLNFALFPKKGGRAPEEMKQDELETLGRQLARLHNVGASRKANHRLSIDPFVFGENNLNYLLENNIIPNHLLSTYKSIATELIDGMKPAFKDITTHRIHGDCHLSNIIYRPDEGFFFIDFDDMLIGPAIQDVWLIIPGRDSESLRDRDIFLDAYTTMRDFDFRTLKLIEPLRTLRYIHFTAWIAKRWEDPSFKNSFPYFGTESYWHNQYNDLREQLEIIGAQL